jgi:hypothetical protein
VGERGWHDAWGDICVMVLSDITWDVHGGLTDDHGARAHATCRDRLWIQRAGEAGDNFRLRVACDAMPDDDHPLVFCWAG